VLFALESLETQRIHALTSFICRPIKYRLAFQISSLAVCLNLCLYLQHVVTAANVLLSVAESTFDNNSSV